MVVPKLFRLLFFRKSSVQNVFDAARDANAQYIDVSIDLGTPIEQIKNSFRLDHANLEEFILNTPKDAILIIYGNHKTRRMQFYDILKAKSYSYIYDAGSIEDLKGVLDSI